VSVASLVLAARSSEFLSNFKMKTPNPRTMTSQTNTGSPTQSRGSDPRQSKFSKSPIRRGILSSFGVSTVLPQSSTQYVVVSHCLFVPLFNCLRSAPHADPSPTMSIPAVLSTPISPNSIVSRPIRIKSSCSCGVPQFLGPPTLWLKMERNGFLYTKETAEVSRQAQLEQLGLPRSNTFC